MTERGFNLASNSDNEDFIKRTNHILAIGIDNYSQIKPLENCVRDTQSFVDILTEKYQFDAEHVTILFNEQATRAAILETLHEMSDRLSNKDNLIIYFAGHGFYSDSSKTGFLVPVDGSTKKIYSLIYNSQIRDYIHGSSVHHLFLLVDSCFSGDLVLRSNEDPATQFEQIYAQRVDAFPSRWGLAAGLIEKVSDGLVGDHSPFAKSLISYLGNHPSPQFAVSELIQHVKKTTTYNAKQTPVGGVLKNTNDQGGEFVFRKKGYRPAKITSNPDKTTTSRVADARVNPQLPQKKPDSLKKQIQNHVIEQELIEALDLIQLALPKYESQVILLKARYNGLVNDKRNGTITSENAQINLNRLLLAINDYTDKITS